LENIDNDYITEAIDELLGVVGAKEDAPIKELKRQFNKGDLGGCVKSIASYLGLPVDINLQYVSDKYNPYAADAFQSKELVVRDAGR
jgi:hypothetical protein